MQSRYLDSLMYQTEKSSFLLKDVKETFRPKKAEGITDMKVAFVKQCQAKGAVPNAAIVVHD